VQIVLHGKFDDDQAKLIRQLEDGLRATGR